MRLLLGVDGGGTKTLATLATFNGDGFTVVGEAAAGPSNIVTVGISAATENIGKAVREAFAVGDQPYDKVESACFAIAGSERASIRVPLEAWIATAGIAERFTIVNDAEPVLFSLCATGQGVAVISGTGSMAFGRDSTGKTARVGGWGPLIGDEGSGYWIALRGLNHAIRVHDGRDAESSLAETIFATLEIRDPSELPAFVAGMDRARIAELASIVSMAAAGQDNVAVNILEAAGTELAALAGAVIGQLADSDQWTVGLSGSVLLRSSIVRSRMSENLLATHPSVQVTSVASTSNGLLQIARQQLG